MSDDTEGMITIPSMPWRDPEPVPGETVQLDNGHEVPRPLPQFSRYAEETERDVRTIQLEKKAKGAKKWLYKKTEEPLEAVVAFFEKPAGTLVREHGEGVDRLVAVWNGPEEGPKSEFDDPNW